MMRYAFLATTLLASSLGVHAAQAKQEVPSVGIGEATEDRIVQILSVPVTDGNGTFVGQVDLLKTTGQKLRLIEFRTGDDVSARDGKFQARQFDSKGKMSPLQLRDGRIKSYGAKVVARSGGICVVVVFAILEDGSFETVEVIQIPCDSGVIIEP